MSSPKKVVNDPRKVVQELIEGLLAAEGGRLALAAPGAVVRPGLPMGKVGLLVGGGSGHEPLFAGFVGENLADGAACGAMFSAPTPDTILAAIRAVDRGAGVLQLYGNYAGDVMNFDLASEMAEGEGRRIRTVRVHDDVASAPRERAQERRGIAGDFLVIKVAGAAAATLPTLDEVARVAARARDETRSMGVALAAGSLPETGVFGFDLGPEEIEIGMGLHGERGASRGRLLPADAIVDAMMARLVRDYPLGSGEDVVLLVNDLGATTMMELLIVTRRVHQILRDVRVNVHETVVGSFCTSQEMAGFSISLLRLDAELRGYWDLPASSAAFRTR